MAGRFVTVQERAACKATPFREDRRGCPGEAWHSGGEEDACGCHLKL